MGKDHRKWPGFCALEIASPIAIVVARYCSYPCPCIKYRYFYLLIFILAIKLIAIFIIPRKSQSSEKEILLVKNIRVPNLPQKLRAMWGRVYFLMRGGMPITYKLAQAKKGETWGKSNYSSGTSLRPEAHDENDNADCIPAS